MVIQLLVLVVVLLVSRWRPGAGPLAAAPVSLLLLAAFAVHAVLPMAWRQAPFAGVAPLALGLGYILLLRRLRGEAGPPRQAPAALLVEAAVALALALVIGLKSHLFEYPIDNVYYLRDLLSAALHRSSVNFREGTCWPRELLGYSYNCRLWLQLAKNGPPLQSLALFGPYSILRIPVVLELLVFGLAYQRLLAYAGMKGWRSGACLVLVVAALGHLDIALVVNHALQGMLLATVVLMETAAISLWYLMALVQPLPGPARPRWGLHGAFGLLVLAQLFLALRLHGVVALLILAFLVPGLGLLGLGGGGLRSPLRLPARDRALMVAASTGLFALVASSRPGALWPTATSTLVVRWGAVLVHLDGGSASVQQLLGSPPEPFAVVSWLVATGVLVTTALGLRGLGETGAERRALWLQLMATYSVAIALILLLPGLGDLYLGLNTDPPSRYRLMWGAILLSPLPPLLFSGSGFSRLGSAVVVGGVLLQSLLALVPQQLPLLSKSRHLIQPGPAAADPEQVLLQVPPLLAQIEVQAGGQHATGTVQVQRPPVLLADPIVAYSLEPLLSQTYRLPTARRIYRRSELPLPLRADRQLNQADATALAAVLTSMAPAQRPEILVQQRAEPCRLSSHGQDALFDRCLSSVISRSYVNGIPAHVLRGLGYRPISSADGRYTAWSRVPNPNGGALRGLG